jgi:4-hydroxybenzoate polyprenyltransferase
MMWGSLSLGNSGWPGLTVFALILVAMVTCRTAAMSYNRIADRDIDAKNPRTATRAIPAGLLQLRTANLYFFGSVVLFLGASALLNPLTLILSPIALLVTLGYSKSKRFTWLCHFILGLSLGIAPAAAHIAVTGRIDSVIFPLVAAVLCWTSGFDLIYALQDEAFDKENGLHSVPERFGKAKALLISRSLHTLAVVLLAASGAAFGAGIWWYAGCVFAAAMLFYEQSLVKPDDLSRVNMAFFTLNGFVSIGMFAFALLDIVL